MTCNEDGLGVRCHGFKQAMSDVEESDDSNAQFGLYFCITFIILLTGQICFGALFTLSDSVCVEILGDDADQFGKQVVWGSLGWGVGSSVAALLVQNGFTAGEELFYHRSFYFFFVVMVAMFVTALVSLRVETSFVLPNLSKEILIRIKHPRIILYFLAVCMHGFNFSGLMVFGFWYLRELGAPQILFAALVLTEAVTEIPYFFWSDLIINKFGHIPIFCFGFIMFAARHIGIALLTNPWWSLLIYSLFHGASFPLMYAVQISYCKMISPPGAIATLQGLSGACFEGIGTGVGALIGGVLYSAVGGQMLFVYFGVSSFVFSLVLVIASTLLDKFYTKPIMEGDGIPTERETCEVAVKQRLGSGDMSDREKDMCRKSNVNLSLIGTIHFMYEPTFWLDPHSHTFS